MKRIVTALVFVIALGREGHSQSELKVIPENGALFNIDLSADMQLMSAVARGATGFNIFIDMGNRIGVAETSKKLNFLLHSLKPDGETYVLHLTDNKGNLMVTYDQSGKVLKEERK